MKAVLCKAFGPPETLAVETIDPPKLEPGFIRIAVHAVGVNFPDLLLIEGKYQLRPAFPFSPGLECAGVVMELGDGADGPAVGTRVLAFLPHGCMAEEVVAPAACVVAIPDAMPFDVAAAFPVVYGTSYHALVERGTLAAGETLLVHGASGGVGLSAVEIGKKIGATVIATAGSDEKLAIARRHGADHLINYRTDDFRKQVKALTDGRGADVIYDPVGGDIFDTSMRCIAWRGRLLVIGFASGRIAEAKTNLILLKECSVVGVAWGSFAQRNPDANRGYLAELLHWYEAGALKPYVSRTLPLEDARVAFEAFQTRQAVGKQVLLVDRPGT
jgi:NADPH2:quinone reductase